jgi:two-component system nitrate/nitrite response regulator NarL
MNSTAIPLSPASTDRDSGPQNGTEEDGRTIPRSGIPAEETGLPRLLIASTRKPRFERLFSPLAQETGINLLTDHATEIEQIPSLMSALRPDLFLLDMPSLQGHRPQWLSAVRATDSEVGIVLVCDPSCSAECDEILRYGLRGCLAAEAGDEMLAKAVRAVANGEFWLPRRVLERGFAAIQANLGRLHAGPTTALPIQIPDLTDRERCIAELVAQGLTNKEIAKQVSISSDTVKKHVQNIFAKVGVSRRSELAALLAAQRQAKPPPVPRR